MRHSLLLATVLVTLGSMALPASSGAFQSATDTQRPPPGMNLTSVEGEDAILVGRTDMMAFRLDRADSTFQLLLGR